MFRKMLWGGLALLLASLAALGEEKYDLRLHLRQGQSWSFDQVYEEQQKSRTGVPDHPQIETDLRTRSIRKGRMTVLAVSDGVPTTVQVSFDAACVNEVAQEGAQRTVDFPFAGLTATVKRNFDGRITTEFDRKPQTEPDPVQRGELEACLGGNEGRPAKPVAVGETWQPDLNPIKQGWQLTEQDQVVASSKLVRLATLNDQRVAEVTNYLSITKRQGEMTLTEVSRGALWFDLETGALVKSSIDGATSARGNQPGAGLGGQPVRLQVDNSGKSQLRLSTAPAKPEAALAKQEQPRKAANPLGADAPTPAPAAPPAAVSWPGTYRDAQVTLELKADSAGGFEGSILFKEQKFPLTARAEGNQLKGQFRSDAEAFDFTATREEKNLTLSTGGKNYQLKKQAVNPLGEL